MNPTVGTLPTNSIPDTNPATTMPVVYASASPTAAVAATGSARDWFTILLGASISVVTLILLVVSFLAADSSGRKDLLSISLSLMATVTGYFFGRTPMESATRLAQGTAAIAQQQLRAEQAGHALAVTNVRSQARQALQSALDTLPTRRSAQEDPFGLAHDHLERAIRQLT